jgi:glycerol-3-phosphate O-acyltransferase
MKEYVKITNRLDPVVSEITEWPIYKLSQDKDSFLKEIVDRTVDNLLEGYGDSNTLHSELKSILYQEKNRLTKEPWKSDTPEERIFWGEVKRRILLSDKAEDEKKQLKEDKKILQDILKFYSKEIVANFDPKKYRIARRVLPFLFSRLMNASPGKKLRFLFNSKKTIYDKFNITGPIDHIRNLSKKGTVIIVPTHFSNIDSPTIGLVIDIIGLPAMTYGAGINLFTIGILSRWLNDLGAYKLDRRRKNKPYLELLKNYSTVAINRGAHSLFFPGGTRSRSGQIEKRLKLGLLGTALEAQRENLLNFQEDTAKKIFVVPVVLNYHFVMEASSLINQHLAIEGKEQYIPEKEDFSTSYKLLKLIFKVITANPGMTVSFSSPMDVVGNEVDFEGNSINNIDQRVQIKDYFSVNGVMTEDKQRDNVYTATLGKKIVQKFLSANTVLSSHLVAFVAFELIQNEFKNLDIYQLLRIPADEIEIDSELFKVELNNIKEKIMDLYAEGKLRIHDRLKGENEVIIKHGLKNLGVYHPVLPLLEKSNGNLITEDLKVLYFYHNRLLGYGLERHFK